MPAQSQLEGMRARYRDRLPRTCTVPGAPRTVRTQDWSTGVGGTFQESYAAPVRSVRCSFHALGGGPKEVEGALEDIVTHELRFEHAAVLSAGMQITVDAAADDPARRFVLVAPFAQPFPVGRRWMAKEIANG